MVSTIELTNDITMEDTLVLERNLVIKSDSTGVIRTLTSAPTKRHFKIEAKVIPEDISETAQITFSKVVLDGNNLSGGVEQVGDYVTITNLAIKNFSAYEMPVATDNPSEKVEYAVSAENAYFSDLNITACHGSGVILTGKGTLLDATIEGILSDNINNSTIGVKVDGTSTLLQRCSVMGFSTGCFSASKSFSITNSSFFGNRTGASFLENTNIGFANAVRLTGCHIYNNASDGIYAYQEGSVSSYEIVLKTCKIYGNTCGLNYRGAKLVTDLTEIYGNTRGIHALSAIMLMEDSKVYSNSSYGIYGELMRITTLNGCEITNNGSEEDGGGGIIINVSKYSNGLQTYISNTTISENTSNKNEYHFYTPACLSVTSDTSTTEILGCEIKGNHSDSVPGGIHISSEETNVSTIADCNIHDNTTLHSKGGGMSLFPCGNTINVNNCLLTNNFARRGGAVLICAVDSGTVSFTNNCKFSSNTAEYSGGAIEATNYNCLSTDKSTKFTGNVTTKAGAEVPPEDADTNYPNIKYASTSIYEHPLNNYDIAYCPGIRDEYISRIVTIIPDQTVYFDTALSELVLPEQVEIVSDTSGSKTVDVDWSNSGYDPTKSGSQTIYGTLILGEHMINPDELAVSANIIVYAPNEIVSCTGMNETINVMKESKIGIAELIDKSQQLPTKSVVTLGNGQIYQVPILWNKENIFDAPPNGNIYPEYYWIEGDLDISAIQNLNEPPESKAKFTLVDRWNFVGNESLENVLPLDTKVNLGTTEEQLLNMLSTNYPRVCVTFFLGGWTVYKMFDVTWDIAGSNYDSASEGNYTVYGDLVLNGDGSVPGYQNPRGVRAEIIVNVGAPSKVITIIECEPIGVRQNFLIEQPNQEPAKVHAGGGTPSYESLPASAKVTFDDNSFEQIEIPSWTRDSSNPNLYLGTLDLSNRSDISPTEERAELVVEEIQTDYEVWSVDSADISLEVNPGTTVEQLNALLAEKELKEIDVTCCYRSDFTSEEPDTFAFLFCDVTIADEATNSQYNKDLPGEYDLTATLPTNFYDPGCIGEVQATTTIHVTVREPLEIASVKPAETDAYQSFAFENIPNLPTQVTAVLEDGQEILIDVTWTPDNYAKDVAAQQTVLGELGALPSVAKLPEDKEIVPVLLVNVIPVNYEITQVVSEEDWLLVDGGLTLAEVTERYQPKKTVEISSVTEGIEVVTEYEVALILEDENNPTYDKETISFYDVTATLDLPDNITYANPEGNLIDVIVVVSQAVDVNAESLEATAISTVENTPFSELNLPETVLVPLTNGKTVSIPVDWGTGEGYNPSPEGLTEDNPVDCEITGELMNCPDYINGTGVPVKLRITVTRPLIYTIESISPARFPDIGSMDINLGTELEDICSMLDSTTVQITANSGSGTQITVPLTFFLRQEDNPSYNPMTVGEYTLVGYLPLEDNFVNPQNLQVQVIVKTNRYTISNVTPVRVPGVLSGTSFSEVPLPETVTVTRNDKKAGSVAATWIEGNYNPSKIGNQTVKGTLVTPLPVHLENPNNRQPIAMVTVVNPAARIVAMEQVFEKQNGPMLRKMQKEDIAPGYVEYKYRVKLQHDSGTVAEEIISLYKKIG